MRLELTKLACDRPLKHEQKTMPWVLAPPN
jgi:hypothetical protein